MSNQLEEVKKLISFREYVRDGGFEKRVHSQEGKVNYSMHC